MYSKEQTQRLHDSWKWLLGTGLCLAVLGVLAIVMSGFTTVVSVITTGAVFLVGGLAHIVHAVATRQNRGAIANGLIGALYGLSGYMLMAHPLRGALTVTFVIAALLLASGIAKLVLAFQFRKLRVATYMVINAIGSVLLSTLIFLQWPASSLWVIGTFVGIALIMDGFSLSALGLSAKQSAPLPESRRTPVETR